jgi:hypothetical protein
MSPKETRRKPEGNPKETRRKPGGVVGAGQGLVGPGATHVSVNTMGAGLASPDAHIDAIRQFKRGTAGSVPAGFIMDRRPPKGVREMYQLQ